MTENRNERDRIRFLEKTIDTLESNFQHIPLTAISYQELLIRLDELKLEYKERTGQDYDNRGRQ